MRDYILSAPDEVALQAVLPEHHEEGAWDGCVIANATIWERRPKPVGEGDAPGDPGERREGFHLILRADALPEAAQQYLVEGEPVDIEPVFAGGLKLSDTRTPAVPRSVSAVQFRITAASHGILGTIEAIIADEQTPQAAKIAWEHAREFERASPTIETLRQHPSIDLTAEEVDDLFRQAVDIKV